MKTTIVLLAILGIWLLLSQGIAWAITPDKNPDSVTDNWRNVFILPIMLIVIAIEWARIKLEKKVSGK